MYTLTNFCYSPFILVSDAEGEEEEGEGNTVSSDELSLEIWIN